MDVKLTLKLDKEVINEAKKYAALKRKSLSGIIEAYLKSITTPENENTDKPVEISEYVKSLKSGVMIPENLNEKDAYGDYLSEKYQ